MSGGAPSLRWRLALIGGSGVVVLVAVLITIVLVTGEDIERTASGQSVERDGVSAWVPVTALAVGVVGCVGAWVLAGRAVRPLQRITDTADSIQEGSLERRIDLVGAPDEVQALADSFDRMLDRLADSADNQRRLIEDVGHDLRTPLAALAANIELLEADSSADSRRRITLARSQIDRLERTLATIQSDARSRERRTSQIDNDLVAIARRVADNQRLVTPAALVDIEAPTELRVGIDAHAVERALSNLVENAVRHSPSGEPITIEVRREDQGALLQVTDAGPGIPEGEQATVFERYRGSGGDPEGRGIGLALVWQVAQTYGGVSIDSPLGPHGGTRITMRFDR